LFWKGLYLIWSLAENGKKGKEEKVNGK